MDQFIVLHHLYPILGDAGEWREARISLGLARVRDAFDCMVDCLYAGGVIAFSAVAVPARRWRRTVIERFRANHLIALANVASFSASATFPSGLRGLLSA